MSLAQLREVRTYVEENCMRQGWTSTNPAKHGELLTPETVTLYDLNYYFIMPATKARRCSYVELVASGPQKPQWFVSHWCVQPCHTMPYACVPVLIPLTTARTGGASRSSPSSAASSSTHWTTRSSWGLKTNGYRKRSTPT